LIYRETTQVLSILSEQTLHFSIQLIGIAYVRYPTQELGVAHLREDAGSKAQPLTIQRD